MGLFDIFSNTNAQDAANSQINGLQAANAQGQSYLSNGYSDINTALANGLAPLTTTFNSATNGANAYGDATGANGAAGAARAVQAFQNTNPGYQFALDQGTQNVDRNQAAMGALNSGNTDAAVANYTTGLANQTWNQYVQNLQPYLGQQSITGGQIANTNLQGANLQNQNQTTAANMAYGTQAGIGNAQASADLANNNASANLLNFGQNLLGLGVQGGGTLGGNAISSIGNGLSSALMAFI